MSGIATKTRLMVDAIETTGSRTVLLDTRKTAPGLRALDKAAVVIGGGRNHRHGLYDAVLIKDNHIAVAGGIAAAFDRVQRYLKETRRPMEIVIEAQTLAEVDEVLALDDGVTRILLDNMIRIDNGVVNTTMLEAAIAHIGDRIPTEASGNITQATVGAVARTGVDFISSGELTHSVVAMDLSLKIVIDQ